MMGTRGPLSEPAHLKLLRGNPGQRPVVPDPEIVPIEAPTRPRWLIGEARAEWNRVVKELLRQRRLAKTDRAMLVAHCVAWAAFVEATAQMGEEGYIDRRERSEGLSAWFKVWDRLNRRVIETSRELGLSVSTRLRLPVRDTAAKPSEDGLDALRSRGSSTT